MSHQGTTVFEETKKETKKEAEEEKIAEIKLDENGEKPEYRIELRIIDATNNNEVAKRSSYWSEEAAEIELFSMIRHWEKTKAEYEAKNYSINEDEND